MKISRKPDTVDIDYDELSGMLDIENTCKNYIN